MRIKERRQGRAARPDRRSRRARDAVCRRRFLGTPQSYSHGDPRAWRDRTVVVAVPAKGEADRIGGCLRALERQTRHPDAVLLLLNNCSDLSETVARNRCAAVSFRLHFVCHVFPPDYVHAGSARGLAMPDYVHAGSARGLAMPDYVHAGSARGLAMRLMHGPCRPRDA
jgi:hypothetical protein